FDATLSPEATAKAKWHPNSFRQVSWKAPITNRFYLDASWSEVNVVLQFLRQEDPIVSPGTIAATTQQGAISRLRNFGTQLGAQNEVPDTYRVAGNYVTGSHAFKAGFTLRRGRSLNNQGQDAAISYRLTNSVNGIPNQITEYANSPTINDHKM